MVLSVATVKGMEFSAAWISAGAAIASVFLTGLSWHLSNLSKAARKAADEARDQATRKVDAAEKQADELRRLVKSLSRPDLEASCEREGKGKSHIWLRNTTDESITIDEVINEGDFSILAPHADPPFTLPGGAQTEMLAIMAMEYDLPSNLHLRLGDGSALYVPLQPR